MPQPAPRAKQARGTGCDPAMNRAGHVSGVEQSEPAAFLLAQKRRANRLSNPTS
jgi:hypothetical protein